MKTEVKELGTIKLNKKIVVGDPCYDVDSVNTVKNVKPGIYHVFLRKADANSWGERISRIMVIHQDNLAHIHYEDDDYGALESRFAPNLYITDGEIVGVDSGQAGVYDYDYFCRYQNQRDYGVTGDWYNSVCQMTLSKEKGGVMDSRCAVSSSGYGDGGYRNILFHEKATKQVVGIIIDFDVELENYEDDYDDEEDDYDDEDKNEEEY